MSSNLHLLIFTVFFSSVTSDHSGTRVIFPSVHQVYKPKPSPTFSPSQSFTTDNLLISERVIQGSGFRSLRPSCKNTEDNDPCENDNEYNFEIEQKFNAILQGSTLNNIVQDDLYRSLLNDTVGSNDPVLGNPNTVMTRFGGIIEESPACSSRETIIYPRRAKTANNDWAFILNQGTVKQGVRVEKCNGEGSSCDNGGGSASNIATVCRQKYIYRKMLVMDTSGSNIIPESVIMPSCCVCYIKRTEENVGPRIRNITTPITALPPSPPPSFINGQSTVIQPNPQPNPQNQVIFHQDQSQFVHRPNNQPQTIQHPQHHQHNQPQNFHIPRNVHQPNIRHPNNVPVPQFFRNQNFNNFNGR